MHTQHNKFCWLKRASGAAALMFMGTVGAQAATPFTFITNWYAQAEHGGFYQAKAEGLYDQAGLDVTIRMGGPQINQAQLLAAGRAQCIISDDIGTMMARERGVPITMVATSFQHDPTVVIAHSDVNSLADLKGHTVLMSSSAHSSWWPWAKETFGFTDRMSRPYTFNIQPFMIDKSLAQQGYISSEPYAMKEAGADFKVFPLGENGYPPYGNAIACRDDLIKEHPEQVQAFIHASMQGFKDYLADPTQGNKVILKENPEMTQGKIDFAIKTLKESGMIEGGDAAKLGIGVITDERMQKTWDMVTTEKLVNADKVSLADVYTTKFVNENPVLP